jgi:hypothetical protein
MFFAPYATSTGGLAKPRSSDASASSRWARGDREGLVERGQGPPASNAWSRSGCGILRISCMWIAIALGNGGHIGAVD